MKAEHIRTLKEIFPAGCDLKAVGSGLPAGLIATPDQHLHAEGLAVSSDQLADAAIAPQAECLAVKNHAEAEVGGHGR